MATNLPSCFSIQFLEQLLKFLVNFTLLKYVQSQRNYGFLIIKELLFSFQILDLKDHFSASLIVFGLQFFCFSNSPSNKGNIFLDLIEYKLNSLRGANYISVHIRFDLERYLLNIKQTIQTINQSIGRI